MKAIRAFSTRVEIEPYEEHENPDLEKSCSTKINMNLKVDYICRDCILLFSNVYSIWLDLNKLFMKMKFYEIKTNI